MTALDSVLFTASNGIQVLRSSTFGSQYDTDPDDPTGGPRYYPCLLIRSEEGTNKTFPIFATNNEGANEQECQALEECYASQEFSAFREEQS